MTGEVHVYEVLFVGSTPSVMDEELGAGVVKVVVQMII